MIKRLLYQVSIRAKLGFLALVGIVGLLSICVVLLYHQYQQSLIQRQGQVRHAVETSHGLLLWAQQQEQEGRMDRAQAQAMARAALAKMRHGDNEYFWINDLQGTVVMHPIKPELDGASAERIRDAQGLQITLEAAKIARSGTGQGFFNYQWVKPGQALALDKISYVQHFAPWGWVVGSGLYVDDLYDEFLANLSKLALVVLAMVLLMGWVSYIVSASIVRGVQRAIKVIDATAQGDLSIPITVKGKDEVSILLQTLKNMQSQLAAVVLAVRQGSDAVAMASAEIAQGNQDLSARTEHQASNLQQTAASMQELGSAVRHNADNAHQANQLAQSASGVAAQGGQVVEQVVETMRGIQQASSRMSDILSVIDGIAFQTNILALNAAVEAARAGEQGRGFAVVASEVRALAGRSAEAAKEIKVLIDASLQRVHAGTSQADQAGQTMQEVVHAIERVRDIMGAINSASARQSAGVLQVGEAVRHMDQSTQHNAALVEEMASAAASLSSQARSLVEAVAVFRLDGHPASAPVMLHPRRHGDSGSVSGRCMEKRVRDMRDTCDTCLLQHGG